MPLCNPGPLIFWLLIVGSALDSVDVSAQPRERAKLVDAIGDPLPEGALARFGTLRFRPGTGIDHLALSPDESLVVTVGNHVTAWDTNTGKLRWRSDVPQFGNHSRGSRYGARGVAFAADSSEVFTTNGPDQISSWNTADATQAVIPLKLPDAYRHQLQEGTLSLDVTSDAELFALGRADGILVFDAGGEVRFDLPNDMTGPVTEDKRDRLAFFGHYSSGRFSPHGSRLAALTSDRPDQIRLYDAATGRERQTLALKARAVRFEFSPDGKRLVITERDNAVRMYDAETGDRLWERVIELKNIYENYTSAVAFTPDGRSIAVGATDHLIHLLEAGTGEEIGPLKGHHWYPWTLAFTKNGERLYSGGWDGVIRRWDVPNRMQLPPPEGTHGSEIIAASPDGETLAVQNDAGTIQILSIDGTVRFNLPEQHVSQLRFSPDGKYLAGGGGRGDQVQVTIWEVSTGQQFRHWSWPKGRDPHSKIEAFSFAADGNKLAAAVFRQSSAYVWDLAADKQLAHVKHGQIYGLSFSPDGRTLATAGWDSMVRLWDIVGWEAQRELKIAGDDQNKENADLRMYAVCFAPQGGLLATTHMDGFVRAWQLSDMSMVSESRVQGSFGYNNLSFSPDGLWVAAGSSGGSIELFEPLTGKQVWSRRGHQHFVYSLSFGRDSRTLVTGSDDGLGYRWDLRPGKPLVVPEFNALWNHVSGEDSHAAYDAMWALSDEPDRAVPLLRDKLRPVNTLVAPAQGEADQADVELEELQRLQRAQVEEDPKVEFELTFRRSASVLSQIGTPEAIELLEELSRKNSLKLIAGAALKRAKPASTSR